MAQFNRNFLYKIVAVGGAIMAFAGSSEAEAKNYRHHHHHHGHGRHRAVANNLRDITATQLIDGPIPYELYLQGVRKKPQLGLTTHVLPSAKPAAAASKPVAVAQATTSTASNAAVLSDATVTSFAEQQLGYKTYPSYTELQPKMMPQAKIPFPENTGIVAIAVAMDPLHPVVASMPRRLNNIGSTAVALDIAIKTSNGAFTGQMKNLDPAIAVAGNLLIARIESNFDGTVAAPASAFKNPFNKADRPAGTFQFSGATFATSLAPVQDKVWENLNEKQRAIVAPTFAVIDSMAERYAARTGHTKQEVKQTPYLMGQAYRSAPDSEIAEVRAARISTIAFPGEKGMQTTKGAYLSALARLSLQDQTPAPSATYADNYSNVAWNYMFHLLGEDKARQVVNGTARRNSAAFRNNRSVAYNRTAAGILSGLDKHQFASFDTVTKVVENTFFSVPDNSIALAPAANTATSAFAMASTPTRPFATISFNTRQKYPYTISGPRL